MPPILVPMQGQTLAGVEPLVDDVWLERVWTKLMEKYRVEDQINFATYVQETEKGLYAGFAAVSLHPKQRFPGQQLDTRGTMPLAQWLYAKNMHTHYVGVPDPLEAIFEGLLLEHLTYRQNLKELID